MKQFTILNLLTFVTLVAAILSWVPASKPPQLPDGYIWSHRLLKCEYPETPASYPNSTVRFSFGKYDQKFDDGNELYQYYFHQGWWICRRNFFENTDGYPFDESDWDYINSESVQSAPDDDFGKFPQLAMRDGCRACSRQIDKLLSIYTPEQLRDRLIISPLERYSISMLMTFLATAFVTVKIVSWRKSARQENATT